MQNQVQILIVVTKFIILIIINNNNNRNNIVNNNRNSDSENRIINISNSENYNIVTSNLGNSSIGDENRGNLSNFLNNECVNIYVMWYRLYNFLLGGMDADIIDLNYKKKEWISKQYNNKI